MSNGLSPYEREALGIRERAKPHQRRLYVQWDAALRTAARILNRSITYPEACEILGFYTCNTMPDDLALQLFIVRQRLS